LRKSIADDREASDTPWSPRSESEGSCISYEWAQVLQLGARLFTLPYPGPYFCTDSCWLKFSPSGCGS
jgi:hypothetical protein